VQLVNGPQRQGRDAHPEDRRVIESLVSSVPSQAGFLPAALGVKSRTPPLVEHICRLYRVQEIERRHVYALGEPDDAIRITADLGSVVSKGPLGLRSPLAESGS
jgi:hypothetical protein